MGLGILSYQFAGSIKFIKCSFTILLSSYLKKADEIVYMYVLL